MVKKSLDPKTLIGIKKVLVKEPSALLGYVFGSQSNGVARSGSDFDLAIVVKDRQKRSARYFLERLVEVPGLDNLHLSVVDLSHCSPLFLHQIVKSGQVVFARSERDRIEFETRVASFYFDTQHLRDVQNYYLNKRLEQGKYGY